MHLLEFNRTDIARYAGMRDFAVRANNQEACLCAWGHTSQQIVFAQISERFQKVKNKLPVRIQKHIFFQSFSPLSKFFYQLMHNWVVLKAILNLH
jgi:hypothetical protein